MKLISSKQKAQVRKLAQSQKAQFQIGAKEVHEGNIEAINEYFNNNEIVKIKVNREDIYDKEITKEVATMLEKELKAQVAGVIGTTIILYRENEDKDKRIKL